MTGMVIPMGLGSVIGSIAGAAIIGLIPAALLTAMLGCILVISALKIFSAVVVPAPNAAGAAGSGVSHR